MKNIITLLALSFLIASCAQDPRRDKKSLNKQVKKLNIQEKTVDYHLKTWSEEARSAAHKTMKKYGTPHEVTLERIIWKNVGPYRNITVFNQEVLHLFPVRHSDVISYSINYSVPVNKIDDLSAYNGSLSFDRTQGELTITEGTPEAALLSLNLAHQIIHQDLSAEKARKIHTQSIATLLMGHLNQYMSNLNFMLVTNTADPDQGRAFPVVQAQEAK